MHRFYKPIQQHRSFAVTQNYVYTVDNHKVPRDNIGDYIRGILAGKTINDSISIQKIIEIRNVTHFMGRLSTNTDKYQFTINIPCYILKKALNDERSYYFTLIWLALSVVDSAVATYMNYKSHYRVYETSVSNYFNYLFSIIVDPHSHLREEIQKLFAQFQLLSYVHLVYSLTRGDSIENQKYVDNYGDACLPNINFPRLPNPKEIIDEDEAKRFADNILANVDTIKGNIMQSDVFIPEVQKYALETLASIKELASNFVAVLDNSHKPSIQRM